MSATSLMNVKSGSKLGFGFANFGTSSSSRAIEIESWSYIRHKNHHLQLLQKNETKSTRPRIPASRSELMAYFRCYTSTIFKTQFLCGQDIQFSTFILMYCLNLAFKSIPSTYVHIFLSIYAPEEHFFLSKMSVISYGVNWQIIATSILEFTMYIYHLIRYLNYVTTILWNHSAMNLCLVKSMVIQKTLSHCITLEEVKRAMQSKNVTLDHNRFVIDGKQYQLAQIFFYRFLMRSHRKIVFFGHISILYFAAVLIIAAVYGPIYKKWFWKTLYRIHWIVNVMKLLIMVHLILMYIETGIPEPILKVEKRVLDLGKLIMTINIDFLAESMTAPPVLHFLMSRCTHPINAATDTFLLNSSNGIYFIFHALLTVIVKAHCEANLNSSIRSHASRFPWFYLFPIYFSTSFSFGDVLMSLCFVLLFLEEYCNYLVTFHSLIEIMISEWPKVKRWIVVLAVTVTTGLLLFTLTYRFLVHCYIYSKVITTFTELVIIVLFYPASRLIDDMEFHFGTNVSNLKSLLIKLTLFYYGIKIYRMITTYWEYTEKWTAIEGDPGFPGMYWNWSIILVIFAISTIYIIIKTLVKKQSCLSLFRPQPTWGPREHIQRQLRKQYDSREYVCSESSRYLSRYLMSKAQTQTYKLDICYTDGLPTRKMSDEDKEKDFDTKKL